MGFAQLLLVNALVVLAATTLLWLLATVLKDVSIVDIFWGFGFVLIAWVDLILVDRTPRSWLIAVLVSLWGLRLTLYLARRNVGKPEDHRYRAMRERSGGRFWWTSLFYVFWLQGALMWLIGMLIPATMSAGGDLNGLDFLAAAVALFGLLFESVGDYQLARFKADPDHRGKVFDRGLWRYTRHPNYFGESLVWWGFYGVALAGGAWWMAFSPLLMTFLLLRVSGVSLLEKSLAHRTEGYREYVRRTSAFIPWPPKRA